MEIDWKKKYNEALEKIKRYTTDKYGCTRLKPADIFPELSNDDERMKKAIIDALNSHNNSINLLSSRGYSMDDVISYLEKQKAVNEKESFTWTRHDEAVRKEAIACLENWKGAIIRVGGLVDYDNILAWLKEELPEKQKEQQEVNCDFYNKELSDMVSAELYKYSGSNSIKSPWALDSTGVQYPLYFANLGAKWQKKQKSGEWNAEDERIRNEILEYFLITRARDFIANPERQKWISYIEKQKESGIRWYKSDNRSNPKKPYIDKAGMFYTTDGRMCYASEIEKQKEQAEELSTRLNGLMQEYVKSGKDEEEQEHRLKCYHLFWDALGDSEFFKQREQKPIEKQDYSGLTDFERAIHRGFLVAGVENVSVNIIKETAQDCLAQQKQEWSDEDERMLSRCIKSVESSKNFAETQTFKEAKDKEKDWLKSLPERFNLQTKQEWSEEDKEILRAFKFICKKLIENPSGEKFSVDPPYAEKMLKFLESLCPDSKQEPICSWKPSKEQMGFLNGLLTTYMTVGQKQALKSLIGDLKKL